MDNGKYELQKRYKYIFDVYSISLAQYELLKSLFDNYDSNSKVKETEIIIQALIDAIICNLCKILADTKENKITIRNLINCYNRYIDIPTGTNKANYKMIKKGDLPDINNSIKKLGKEEMVL